MLIVPVARDKIRIKDDGAVFFVSSFTMMKSEPAVYTRADGVFYFSDIIEINDVRVEYEKDSKVFKALGLLGRKFNLPQPKEQIKIQVIDDYFNKDPETLVVKSLRLHSTRYGKQKGLLVITDEGVWNLGELIDIKHEWNEQFNQNQFKKYYFDYLPLSMKHKS